MSATEEGVGEEGREEIQGARGRVVGEVTVPVCPR